MTIIADTPEKIAFFRLAALKSALLLESKGMKRRGQSALSIAKSMGFKAKTAKEAYSMVSAEIEKIKASAAA